MTAEKKEQVVIEVKVCKQCEAEFNFTQGEKEFYDGLGYNYPERCEDCRKKNKENKKKKEQREIIQEEVAKEVEKQLNNKKGGK